MCADHSATAVSYLQQRFPAARQQELRNQLGSLGCKGGTATQPLHTLSGGQAVRVALAGVFFTRPHFLILDEPSNHLDLEGVECLAAALQQFAGAVLLVSHDQASGGRAACAARGLSYLDMRRLAARTCCLRAARVCVCVCEMRGFLGKGRQRWRCEPHTAAVVASLFAVANAAGGAASVSGCQR